MITYFYYFIATLLIIVLQTTLFVDIFLSHDFVNLMTLFVLYLGLDKRFRDGLPVAFFGGLAMDAVTGGPFGLFFILYFWLIVAVQWSRRFFHAGSIVFLPLVTGIGVLLEYILSLSAAVFLKDISVIPADALQVGITQLIWAVSFGPVFLILCRRVQTLVDRLQDERTLSKQN